MTAAETFAPEIYERRRARLAEQVESGVALLLGNLDSPINYADNVYRFRQDSSLLYFTGVAQPGVAAIIDLESGETTLYGNDPTLDDLVWTGPQPALTELAGAAGIERTAPLDALAGTVADCRRTGRLVHALPPYRAETATWLAALLGEGVAPSAQLVDAVVEQRSRKEQAEVEEIERAVEVSVAMHLAALRGARPGRYEREIAAEIEAAATAAGMRTAFPIIATVRGETLHNHDHHRQLQSGQLFLTDTGAETAMGYAADLSRTGPVDARFTSRQREIYDLTLVAHRATCAAVAPGVRFLDIHLLACRTLVEGLCEIGLMRGNPDDAVAAGAHALFFPCGTGHMMGLDVHDMESLGEDRVGYGNGTRRSDQFGLRSLRLARPLEPGFVVTVEPGVYFIPALIDSWQAAGRHRDFIAYDRLHDYREFGGIRSEDDLLVTEQGARVLGPELPRDAEAIEQIKAG